jgi:hypothetical protein
MEEIKKVCAVIDMQGFMFNKIFYPRELAICDDSVDISVEIESAFERKSITTTSALMNYRFKNISYTYYRWIQFVAGLV